MNLLLNTDNVINKAIAKGKLKSQDRSLFLNYGISIANNLL